MTEQLSIMHTNINIYIYCFTEIVAYHSTVLYLHFFNTSKILFNLLKKEKSNVVVGSMYCICGQIRNDEINLQIESKQVNKQFHSTRHN